MTDKSSKSSKIEELEAKKLEAEIANLESQKSKADSEKIYSDLENKRNELFYRGELRSEAEESSYAEYANVYHFLSDVNRMTVKECIETLDRWKRRDPKNTITLIFNSPGGSVIDGLALYDEILSMRESGHKIITKARGMAASMGGVLLQAGDERLIGKNAHMLIHEVSSIEMGKLTEIEDEVKFLNKLQDRLLDILAERATISKANIKKRWKRQDWWLSAQECIDLGFADRID